MRLNQWKPQLQQWCSAARDLTSAAANEFFSFHRHSSPPLVAIVASQIDIGDRSSFARGPTGRNAYAPGISACGIAGTAD